MKKLLFVFILLITLSVGCVKVELIQIKGEFTVSVGETITLEVDQDDVTWVSSDTNIAIVSDGVVKGISEGQVMITAQLDDGSSDSVQVKVLGEEGNVKLGIDNIDNYLHLFEGKRVGLITNPTGINSNLESTIDVLYDKVNLVALFAPEHGIRGNLQAGEYTSEYVDEKTGLTVYSLYGATKRPTAAMLSEIDIMCIDIQDAGARFYTYIYTMAYAMEECSRYGKEFIVFDRPNPIGGLQYEGNILDLDYSSFIGYYPLIQRHGMTIGELARLFNSQYNINLTLNVVEMTGWKRDMYYDDTKLPWVIPSPNFPTTKTATVYPGTCIFEGTNLSEGRGTTIPFEVIGAPYIDANELSETLNDLELPGVYFRPAYFTPTFSKHVNRLCKGVQVHVTDRSVFEPVKTGWTMFNVVKSLYPSDFQTNSSLNLLAGMNLRTGNYTSNQLIEIIENDTQAFSQIREQYLIYE